MSGLRGLAGAIAVAAVVAAAITIWRGGERGAPLGPRCDPEADTPIIDGTLDAELFVGEGVSAEHAREVFARVAAYAAEYELTLQAEGAVTRLPARHLLGVEGEGADADGALSELAPLFAFIDEHAFRDDGAVRVVGLSAIAAPESPLDRALPRLRGLTLSPAMTRPHGSYAELPEGLGEDHAPVVLWRATGDARADARSLAHEIGHALGLEHRHAPGNLMLQAELECAPWIDREQARLMREALD